MSELDASLIKRGKWTNLSQGKIMGQTITTDSETGTLVIALLAVFTTLGLTHLFHLCTFFYHQIRADGRPSDGLFRQQQALLRTLPDPSTLATGSIKLWLSWRHVSERPLARTAMQSSIAIAFALGSLVASIFSSSVVSSSNLEVLVDSALCSHIDPQLEQLSYLTTVYSLAQTYTEDCYTDLTSLPVRCKIFIHPRISFTTETVPCPFSDGVCASPALAFDSGLLDLGKDFGLNLATNERVRYRKRTTAALLSREGRVIQLNASDLPSTIIGRAALPNEELLCYTFGYRMGTTDFANCTFFQSLAGSNVTNIYTTTSRSSYTSPERQIAYEPLPELKLDNADLTIRAVGKNAIRYQKPVDDLLFAAHREDPVVTSTDGTAIYYQSDTQGSMIGLLEQYQYCITDSTSREICSALAGWPGMALWQDRDDMQSLSKASDIQRSVLNLLYMTTASFNLGMTDRFKASDLIFDTNHIESLPVDQWKTELTTWVAQLWASHQIYMTDYAIGPARRVPFTNVGTQNPTTAGDQALCGLQKMRKTGDVVNINFFGLVFVLTMSTAITVLDIFVLRFLFFLRGFKSFWIPRINRWLQDGVWQLQRHVYEARGEGEWTNLSDEVPVTKNSTLLADLPLETLSLGISDALHYDQEGSPPIATSLASTRSMKSYQAPVMQDVPVQAINQQEEDGSNDPTPISPMALHEAFPMATVTEHEFESTFWAEIRQMDSIGSSIGSRT